MDTDSTFVASTAASGDHILLLFSALTFGLHGDNSILNNLEIIKNEGPDVIGAYKGGLPQLTADLTGGFGIDCAIFVQLYSMIDAALGELGPDFALPTPLFGLGIYASVASVVFSEKHPGTERAYLTSDNPAITKALEDAEQDCVGQWLVRRVRPDHPEETWAGMSSGDGPLRLPLAEWEDRLREGINEFVEKYADAPPAKGVGLGDVRHNIRWTCGCLIRREMEKGPLGFRLFPHGMPLDDAGELE
jgi:hypothetical protein